jgi:hypothetical protein
MINRGVEHDRARLARILGLPREAGADALRKEGQRLILSLRRRAEIIDESGSIDAALSAEIASLDSALKRFAPPRRTSAGDLNRRSAKDRTGLVAILLGSAFIIAFLIATSTEDRIVRAPETNTSSVPSYMARLVVTGPVGNATLRVLTADRDEILRTLPASGANVDLVPGRYAIEVDAEGCENRWTRLIFLAAGATHRVHPTLCGSPGTVRIQTEVAGAQLYIDDVKTGEPGQDLHSLSAGEHEIRVEKAGYRPFKTAVRIEPGRKAQIVVELVPESPQENIRQEDLAFAFASPVLSPAEISKPAPFDLADFSESLVPKWEPSRPNTARASQGLGRLPDGGSTDWHARVAVEFIARYDHDRSGAIDQIKESDAVSCTDWRQTEHSFERGGLGLSMARYYGFDGSEWHFAALGFSRTMRSAAYTRMRECGLQA